jgi:hypothetical protein
MAKSKSHPLADLPPFNPPKLDETPMLPMQGQPTQPAKTDTPSTPEEDTRSSNVTLPVKVWEWIDAKHAEARSKGGKPLRKAAIIRAVFEIAMSAEADLSGVQSEKDIAERLIRAIKQ